MSSVVQADTQAAGSSTNAPYHAHPLGMLSAKHTLSPPSYFLGHVMKTGDLRVASFFMFPLTVNYKIN